MAECDVCGRYVDLPYQCRRCGGTFCAEHRLPENHDCPGLQDWNDPGGVFDSGFDDSVVREGGQSSGFLDRLTGTGGPLGYFRGNMAFVFLGLMWVVFGAQLFLTEVLGANELAATLFVLRSNHLEYVWTWVTSIFAHGGFIHIAGNSIVLYFFGPLVERYVGSKKFTALFLVSGVLAGLSYIGTVVALDPAITLDATSPFNVVGVVGASGALFAVLGVLTVLNPDLKIYLYFIIPIPLWLFTFGFALLSVMFIIEPGTAASIGQGNVAHFAHLTGLVVGLVYGQRVKGQYRVPSRLNLGRGGGPGGPGGRF